MSKDSYLIHKNLAIFLFFCLLGGCVSAERKPDPRKTQIYAYLRVETIKEGIKTGRIRQGMRYKELSSLLGKPDKVIQIKTERHFDEQWIYEDKTSPESKYFSFHFQDGTLLDWR
jgi:hypothetical protein